MKARRRMGRTSKGTGKKGGDRGNQTVELLTHEEGGAGEDDVSGGGGRPTGERRVGGAEGPNGLGNEPSP